MTLSSRGGVYVCVAYNRAHNKDGASRLDVSGVVAVHPPEQIDQRLEFGRREARLEPRLVARDQPDHLGHRRAPLVGEVQFLPAAIDFRALAVEQLAILQA